jgi:hypothetical protein
MNDLRHGLWAIQDWIEGSAVGYCGSRLTLSLLMSHICGVSKKFGELYQKTNKTEDTNELTLLAFKIIVTVGNVHKASVNCQQRLL